MKSLSRYGSKFYSLLFASISLSWLFDEIPKEGFYDTCGSFRNVPCWIRESLREHLLELGGEIRKSLGSRGLDFQICVSVLCAKEPLVGCCFSNGVYGVQTIDEVSAQIYLKEGRGWVPEPILVLFSQNQMHKWNRQNQQPKEFFWGNDYVRSWRAVCAVS